MKEFFERELYRVNRVTPDSLEYLESFAKANNGSMDLLLMQMAINYGYKIAMENCEEMYNELNK
jgi:hypothetical protein